MDEKKGKQRLNIHPAKKIDKHNANDFTDFTLISILPINTVFLIWRISLLTLQC